MKKTLLSLLLAGTAGLVMAQSQLDATLTFGLPDLNAAPANKVTPAQDQKSSKAPNLDTNVKYSFTAKLDDNNTVKAGATVDLYTPFYVGTGKYQTQLAAKVIEPFAQYQGFGVDALTSLAVYTINPSDSANVAAGTNALGYYNGPYYGAGAGAKKPQDNKFPVSNYLNASYKYSVDKTLALVAGVETDLSVAPVVFLQDLKPRASVIWTILQLDTKYNLTYLTTNSDDSGKTYAKTYFEPKLTFDLKDLVAGLKVYTGGKLILSNGAPTAATLQGSRWDDGLTYTFTVKDVGTFAFDTYLRVGGIGPDDKADTNLQYDYSLKATYTLKF